MKSHRSRYFITAIGWVLYKWLLESFRSRTELRHNATKVFEFKIYRKPKRKDWEKPECFSIPGH